MTLRHRTQAVLVGFSLLGMTAVTACAPVRARTPLAEDRESRRVRAAAPAASSEGERRPDPARNASSPAKGSAGAGAASFRPEQHLVGPGLPPGPLPRPGARREGRTQPAAPYERPFFVLHKIVRGENLYRIGKAYGVSVEALCRANGIRNADLVRAGTVLTVPLPEPGRSDSGGAARNSPLAVLPEGSERGGAQEAWEGGPGPADAEAFALTEGSRWEEGEWSLQGDDEEFGEGEDPAVLDPFEQEPYPAPIVGAPAGVSFALVPVDEPFDWPISGGEIHSPFGMRRGRMHAGVDIKANSGTPIFSAREGSVIYSGRLRGYGNTVFIDHGDGFVTLYAHNSRNLVRAGESVSRGQAIARVGATGNATGSHCHFEIRRSNIAVDPAQYLDLATGDTQPASRAVPAHARRAADRG